jgi:hypothetical protein
MKQLNGDYMIPVDYIIKNDAKGFFSLEEKKKILSLLQPYDGENFGTWFSIYIPTLELQDTRYPIPTPRKTNTEKKLTVSEMVHNSENPGGGSPFGDPIAVLPPEDLPPSVESLPGYIIDRWGNFHFKANITEEDALHNDVWIFGFQEILCEEASRISDLDLADPYTGIQSVRMPGEMERAGFMQVINGQLNNIRHWVRGKLSMRMVILNQFGNVISDVRYGRTRRWRFKSEKWVNFDTQIGNWNTYTFGIVTYEQWSDVRGGEKGEFTISTPPANGLPGLSVKIPWTNDSNHLGTGIVQFADPKSRIYNSMSFMRFRRM